MSKKRRNILIAIFLKKLAKITEKNLNLEKISQYLEYNLFNEDFKNDRIA